MGVGDGGGIVGSVGVGVGVGSGVGVGVAGCVGSGDGVGVGAGRPRPWMETTAPLGSTPTRAVQAPTGWASESTAIRRVTDSPGASVPAVRLARSQGASDQSRQSTGAPPEAVRVSSVREPREDAATARWPGAPAWSG